MKLIEVFSDLKFEKDDDHISVKANGQLVIIELSDQRLIKIVNNAFHDKRLLYDTAINLHQAAKSAGIKIAFKTPVKQLFSIGDTRFYILRLFFLKLARFLSSFAKPSAVK